ncbi:unnamed protein product [Schistocephalus solidus]|uniref:C2H2-type domain-containing protein n=1 Tax=Schistocephalus solidus TaxID=70667 RepID=A0A183TRE9_SCHSO|nr:unnamed protein product [Schistocephalus solidus]
METFLPPPALAPITATNYACPTPATSVATSDYLPPASFTTTAPTAIDGNSIVTCPNSDRTFTSKIDLIGHLIFHRTETGKLVVNLCIHFFVPTFKLASPTHDNLDTFLRFCNPDDGLQVQLMIKAGSDGFASLIGGFCCQQGRISKMIS